jgi:hypothetical protein
MDISEGTPKDFEYPLAVAQATISFSYQIPHFLTNSYPTVYGPSVVTSALVATPYGEGGARIDQEGGTKVKHCDVDAKHENNVNSPTTATSLYVPT